ncbi:serine/threonine-protein kinase [Nocardia sp. NPDC127579]|uniref:serine/threonine-protein kinase n=1 Tax=Nocardia sp. NPDC127579 TaxID=3345402 RepID=UPI003644A2CB
MLAAGTTFAGYVIERRLGRGGMGSVYLARDPGSAQRVALKLLNRELFADSRVRARFEREADLVGRLRHRNIVASHGSGLEGDQLWIAMQYIDGADAGNLDTRTLPPQQAMRIVSETAAALDFAHEMGVLHRDVKPANILLARSATGPEPVFLTDFGIAKLRDDAGQLTETGAFTATLAFASPEQLMGEQLDATADQYSLACTLFWLLTGRSPFESTHASVLVQGHLQQPAPAISEVRWGLPTQLDAVLSRALSKRPAERFRSCREFAHAARLALEGGPGPVRTPVPGPAVQVGGRPMPPVNRAPTAAPHPPAAMTGHPGFAQPPAHPHPAPLREMNQSRSNAPLIAGLCIVAVLVLAAAAILLLR